MNEICLNKVSLSSFQDLNIIHFNSPKKLNVKNKNAEYFRNHFLTFLQFDGNLLRRDLINCNVTAQTDATTSRVDARDIAGVENDASEVDKDDGDNLECYDLRAARNKVYRLVLLSLG